MAGRIENVVFDMGGVLMYFEPERYARAHTTSDEDARLVADALFCTPEWWQLDGGVIGEETVERCSRERLPERLHPALHETFAHWDEGRRPMDDMNDLVERLRRTGMGLYLLSNAGTRFERFGPTLPCFHCFDGCVVSAFEHLVKPDPAIFALLCERYGLDPATCLFVDDSQRNVEGARLAGMRGFRYDGDEPALEGFLLEHGVEMRQ